MREIKENIVYPARFQPESGGGLRITFPDFPELLVIAGDWQEGMEQAHDRVAEIRRSTQKVTQIRKHLTDTQFRRMWMYFVDGMTIDEIGKVEGVSHQAISLNITAAIRKIKKYF